MTFDPERTGSFAGNVHVRVHVAEGCSSSRNVRGCMRPPPRYSQIVITGWIKAKADQRARHTRGHRAGEITPPSPRLSRQPLFTLASGFGTKAPTWTLPACARAPAALTGPIVLQRNIKGQLSK